MKEYLKLNKGAFNTVMKALNLKKLKCDTCKKKLTKDNFGLIGYDTYSCEDLFCIIHAVDKSEAMKRK